MGFVWDVHFSCRPHSGATGGLSFGRAHGLGALAWSLRGHSSSHHAGLFRLRRARPASHGGTGGGPCLLTQQRQQVAELRLTPGGGPRPSEVAVHRG